MLGDRFAAKTSVFVREIAAYARLERAGARVAGVQFVQSFIENLPKSGALKALFSLIDLPQGERRR